MRNSAKELLPSEQLAEQRNELGIVPGSRAFEEEGPKPPPRRRARVGGASITWIALALVLIVALGVVALWMLDPDDRVADRERNRQPGGEQVLPLVLSVEQGLTAPAPAEIKRLVLLIQRELEAAGFDPGPIDGKPGPRLVAAIEAYQRAHDFPVDGRVSVDLLSRLAWENLKEGRSAPAVARTDATQD